MNRYYKFWLSSLTVALLYINFSLPAPAQQPHMVTPPAESNTASNFELPGDLDIDESDVSPQKRIPHTTNKATEDYSSSAYPQSAPSAPVNSYNPLGTAVPTSQTKVQTESENNDTIEIDPEEDTEIRPELALISFNDQGLLSSVILPDSIEQKEQIVCTPEDLFNEKAVLNLSVQDKAVIIKDLSLFMQSDYTQKVLLPRKVMVVSHDKKNLIGRLFDLELIEEHEIRIPLSDDQRWQHLCSQALLQEWGESQGVVVNMESKQYHQPGAGHLSLNSRPYAFRDEKIAQRKGYEPCPVCFPKTDAYLSMNKQDRELSREGTAQVQNRYALSQDQEAISRVQKAGRKLLEGNGFPPEKCDFVVLNSPEAQALSVHGGPIFITSGLLKLLESDDELVSVLAHEFSHIIRNHSSASKTRRNISNIFGTVMRYTATNYWSYFGSKQAANLINKGFSREQEYEADRDAVMLTFAAGFNPQEFCTTLEKLSIYQKESGQSKISIAWFSTHPNFGQRIGEINKLCQEIEPLQKAALCAQENKDKNYAKALHRSALLYLKNKSSIDELNHSYSKLNWNILDCSKGF
ncbi:MAG: M48 family metalloprotease [Candidatus Bruticola sp.]